MKRNKNLIRLLVQHGNSEPRVWDLLATGPVDDIARAVDAGVAAFNRSYRASMKLSRQARTEEALNTADCVA